MPAEGSSSSSTYSAFVTGSFFFSRICCSWQTWAHASNRPSMSFSTLAHRLALNWPIAPTLGMLALPGNWPVELLLAVSEALLAELVACRVRLVVSRSWVRRL